MQKIINKILTGVIVSLVIVLVFISYNSPKMSFASAPPGLISSVATTSQPTVSTTAISVFATSTCNARVVTTYASPIMMTFSDFKGETPTGVFGHLQAASTTVAYDSGQFGCGLVKIYSFASQTITVTETR